jgi:hypothetical protein
MLTTLPRAAPRAARRLTTGAATRAPLAPPYEHAVRSSLAPPYAQHVPAATDPLQPAYSYQLVQRRAPAQPAPTPAEWVAAVLETEAGRTWAQSAWSEAIAELAEQVSEPRGRMEDGDHQWRWRTYYTTLRSPIIPAENLSGDDTNAHSHPPRPRSPSRLCAPSSPTLVCTRSFSVPAA